MGLKPYRYPQLKWATSDVGQIALMSACAPLARAKDDTMKIISPAPARLSFIHWALIHIAAISLFVAVCSSYVLGTAQEQKVINFLLDIN